MLRYRLIEQPDNVAAVALSFYTPNVFSLGRAKLRDRITSQGCRGTSHPQAVFLWLCPTTKNAFLHKSDGGDPFD